MRIIKYIYYKKATNHFNKKWYKEVKLVKVDGNSEVYKTIKSYQYKEKNYLQRNASRIEKVDYIGLGIVDHAWNNPKCSNVKLISSLIVEDCADIVIRKSENKELLDMLKYAINQLTPPQRRRLILRYFHEYPISKIAKNE